MVVSDPASSPSVEPVLSVVVPMYNEADVIEATYERLTEELTALGEPYELIFVDDGSRDASRALMTARSAADPRVRLVCLSRNFGHEMATTAGLHHARGQAAVVIDADLQDPPELIKEFVRLWREGYHVVYGVRRSRQGETLFKKLTAFCFYRLMSRIGDVRIPADAGDFRLLDRRVLDVFLKLHEDPQFFRGLVTWVGFKQIGVPFERRPRLAGASKYRFGKLLRLAFDTITAFSTFPALVITMLAGFLLAASVTALGLVFVLWLVGVARPEGWVWAALGFLVLINLQFFALAVFGEYLVRTHRNTQGRPLFVVEAVIQGGKPV
jgi:dolichol-phosphate mannosyltransferase